MWLKGTAMKKMKTARENKQIPKKKIYSCHFKMSLDFRSPIYHSLTIQGFPCVSAGKESACNGEHLGWIPGLGRFPGEGKGYPHQYSCLQNSMDCIVHRVTKNWTKLSNFHFFGEGNGKPLQYSCLENSMNNMKRQNDRILKDELPRSVGAQYAMGDQWRNNYRKNEVTEGKQKQHAVVYVTGWWK